MIIENGPYTVYVLIDKTEGFLYVGTTKNEPRIRFNKGEGYRHNKKFYAVIKKYGWENIEQNIFASNLTEKEAYSTEMLLIDKLREQAADLICNRDAGGKHGKHCNETKEIIRNKNVGKIVSDDTKSKIKIARAKQVISHESIMKTAEKNRGRKMSPEFCKHIGETHSKKVLCIETNEIFDSMQSASKVNNVSVSGVSQVCNGKIPHIKGLHFMRV